MEKSIGRFAKVFLVLISVSFALLLLRLWALQVLQGDYYRDKAERNYLREVSVPALRGRIFDRNGKLMADNRPAYELIMNYRSIKNEQKEQNLRKLSEWLATPLDTLTERFETRPCDRFGDKVLLRNMEYRQVVKTAEHLFELPGVQIRSRPKRIYPMGPVACHTIGYIGEINLHELSAYSEDEDYEPGDDIGKSGLERYYETYLRGVKGVRKVQVSSRGIWKEDLRDVKPNLPGADLYLTIDSDLQTACDQILAASAGVIIVMDSDNGDILAMSSSPTFDPNMFCGPIDPEQWRAIQDNPLRPLRNRAVADVYPPGSVFKLIVAWAGFHERLINAHSSFTCPGFFSLGKWKFRCHQKYGHGTVEVVNAIKNSCDVFFYEVGLKLGIGQIAEYSRLFGFGSKLGLDLPEENSGLIPDPPWKKKFMSEPWYPGDTVNSSIGQGFIQVTPLQVASSYAAMSNGGTLYRPRLVRRIADYNNLDLLNNSIGEPIRKIPIASGDWKTLLEGFSAVVNQNGTGRKAKMDNIEICGKTGTAQAGPKGPHAWFVAFTPNDKPHIVILSLIEHGGHGGEESAPVSKEILMKMFPSTPKKTPAKA